MLIIKGFMSVNLAELICSFSSSCFPPGGIAPAQLLSVTGPKVMARSGTFTLRFKCALRRTSADIFVRKLALERVADKNVQCLSSLRGVLRRCNGGDAVQFGLRVGDSG